MGYSARPGNPGGKGPDNFEFFERIFLIHWESNFMSLNLGTKVLAGAIAMAIGGAAMAQTNLNATTTGDVFLNIVNTSNDTSFVYDTGISQANFTSSTTFSVNLASDPNYQTFIAASGTLDYSVISATENTADKANEFTIDSTGTLAPASALVQQKSKLLNAQTAVSDFAANTNTLASTTTNSAFLSGTGTVGALSGSPAFWGAPLSEGALSTNIFGLDQPPFGDSTAPGTAMSFYQVNVNAVTVLGTWDLNGAVATFEGANVGTGTSPVPLPTPLLLLLSGLGLMGVVARRGKPSADFASGATAV
jgi:hypothetical protein